MKRKLIIVIVFIVLIATAIAGVIFYEGFGRKSINKTLSARAEEYLKTKDHSTSLREANLEDQPAAATTLYGKHDSMNSCFNFSIPFTINNHHQEGDCNEYFSLLSPRGTIYANEVTTYISSLNDLSDVAMRRTAPQTYEESHLTAGGREFLVFKNKDEIYQKTAFYFTGSKLFTFTFTSDNTPESDQKFKAMLASLQLL